ncbi:hypothetical protein M2D63_017755 [Pseudomonas sp. BJa5]|uniref:hypothetical protein n=1 Tax=Pseudomonas sp. BJa5 TaxID=2936270 RepID=UPI00255A0BBF|nr:hypothetical protein [Pseudomonas sp. BGr12]MDL2422964.1 hypothetical protein [Pseudomonas sp. BGr12]
MRLQPLLALAAASALLLPLGAHAGKLPAGYLEACVANAQQLNKAMTTDQATKHCDCAGKAIENNFSDAQIADLDSRDGVDAGVMRRAEEAVKKSCPPATPKK